MKNVGLTVSGNRYQIQPEAACPEFANPDLHAAGVNLHQDNTPDQRLKATLRLAKQATSYEDETELHIETLDGL